MRVHFPDEAKRRIELSAETATSTAKAAIKQAEFDRFADEVLDPASPSKWKKLKASIENDAIERAQMQIKRQAAEEMAKMQMAMTERTRFPDQTSSLSAHSSTRAPTLPYSISDFPWRGHAEFNADKAHMQRALEEKAAEQMKQILRKVVSPKAKRGAGDMQPPRSPLSPRNMAVQHVVQPTVQQAVPLAPAVPITTPMGAPPMRSRGMYHDHLSYSMAGGSLSQGGDSPLGPSPASQAVLFAQRQAVHAHQNLASAHNAFNLHLEQHVAAEAQRAANAEAGVRAAVELREINRSFYGHRRR